MKSQKLVPAKSSHSQNRKILYSQIIVTLNKALLLLLFAGTIFCEFLRFGKNRKIKYPQKFLPTYQAPWCIYNHKLRDDFPFWIRHNLSLLIISAFPFFLPVPSRARKVTFDDIDDDASFSSEI